MGYLLGWAQDASISIAVVELSQKQFGRNSQGPVFFGFGMTAMLQVRNNGARTRDGEVPKIMLLLLLLAQASWGLCASFN